MTTQAHAKRGSFKVPGWIILVGFTVAVNIFAIWWSQKSIWPTPKESGAWQTPKNLKSLTGETLDLQKIIDQKLPGAPPDGVGGESHAKRTVLYNIWASWCAPCLAEFPSLIEMAREFEKDGNVLVVAVSVDEDLVAAEKFMKRYKLPSNFVVAFDVNKSFSESVGTTKLPESYLVDAGRNVVLKKFVGSYDWYDKSMLQLLRAAK